MPPLRFWFACLSGLISGAVGAFGTIQVQLAGTPEPVSTLAWLSILGAGLLSAVTAGKEAWPRTL